MLRFDVITIFPAMFDSYLKESILARAQKKKLMRVDIHNLRAYTDDRHHTVDSSPYGGGAGMIIKIEPVWRAVQSLLKSKIHFKSKKTKIVLLSAKGQQFTQQMARRYVKLDRIIFICGRYEGVDERVAKYIADEEVSIGPYVLTGGELPAMVLVDAISRHVPDVLGNKESLKEESFAPVSFPRRRESRPVSLQMDPSPRRRGVKPEDDIRHEYPQYTRPSVFEPRKGLRWKVPAVLLSGDHKRIAEWRKRNTK